MIRYLVEGIDPSEPRVGPVVEWPKDGKCPVHVNAYLRITWPDLEFQPICKRAQDCCWVSGAKDRKCYQVLWSPDEKDYEMPEPEVVVRYQAISHGADCEFVMPHTSQGFNYFIREEFHNGQLIGKPVVLTREEALMECEGG